MKIQDSRRSRVKRPSINRPTLRKSQNWFHILKAYQKQSRCACFRSRFGSVFLGCFSGRPLLPMSVFRGAVHSLESGRGLFRRESCLNLMTLPLRECFFFLHPYETRNYIIKYLKICDYFFSYIDIPVIDHLILKPEGGDML